jgi:TolB-like protein/Tfp pilus assembly protein PilF
MLKINLLGGFAVAGAVEGPRTRKAVFLLAYLALLRGRAETRERLSGLFWSGRSEAQARGSLRQALADIRRICGDALEADSQSVSLHGASCDAIAFLIGVEADAPAALAASAELYRGALLEGLDPPDEGAADWLRVERERLHRAALALLDKAWIVAEDAGPKKRKAFSALAHRILASDPTAEEAHRALIAVALSEGRTTEALRLYDVCAEALRAEFDVEPEEATRELAARARGSADKPRSDTTAKPTAIPSGAESNAPVPPREGPSIVVMPFVNLSGDSDQAIFIDGIVEEITGALARMRDFFVIARQSANTLKSTARDVREIGQKLGVRYVLEGAVRRSGDRVRITVRLIEAESGTHLWSDRFDGEVADVFDFQDEIAARVAGALHPSLRAAEIERARRKRPENIAAYDRVMRAYPHLWAHTKEDNAKAIALLEEAIVENPEYGLAAALLAWCHAQQRTYVWSSDPEEDRQLAIQFADRAARLTDDDATALAAIAAAYSLASRDFALAERYVQRSLAIDPNNAWGWIRAGWVSQYQGDWERGLERFARARRISPFDPLDFSVSFGLGACEIGRGHFLEAVAHVEAGLRAKPGLIWPNRLLAIAAAHGGEQEKAHRAVARLLEAQPDLTVEKVRAALPSGALAAKPYYWEGLRLAGLPER